MKEKNIRYGKRRNHTKEKLPKTFGNTVLKQLAACAVIFLICTPVSRSDIGLKKYISDILVSSIDTDETRIRFSEFCHALTDKYIYLAQSDLWNGFIFAIESNAQTKSVPDKDVEPNNPQQALELVAMAAPIEYVFPDSVEFRSPLVGNITSPFGEREHPVSGGENVHKGVDIAGDFGDSIISAAPGKVIKVASDEFSGNYIVVQHTDNMKSVYAHCEDIYVVEGEIVDDNTLIASVGSTGISTGPHLHFELRVNDESVNPEDYIALGNS